MTSHFRFHDGMAATVPPTAQYQYPNQSTKSWKSLMKVGPKNGSIFRSSDAGAPIRIELPAQGYLNTGRSHLSFDVAIVVPAGYTGSHLRFQNNIQSIFRRARLIYGTLPLETIDEANVLVRMLTEATGTNTLCTSDQTSITEGIGGLDTGNFHLNDSNALGVQKYETRLWKIQSGAAETSYNVPSSGAVLRSVNTTIGGTPQYRRYTVQLPFGLFQQPKFLPLKWMASQLYIELELAPVPDCLAAETITDPAPLTCSYELRNITYNAELHEYDASYDAAFLEGLAGPGVPIPFASWNTYTNAPNGATTQTLNIPERNRSIKAIFNVLLPNSLLSNTQGGGVGYAWDSHAMLGSLGSTDANNYFTGYQKSYQFRFGGKYFPAQKVDNGELAANGGAESYVEFQKALNIVGDYSLSTAIDSERWQGRFNGIVSSSAFDFKRTNMTGNNALLTRNPSCYVTAINLESSNGAEISGINGEEQNDIALTMTYSTAQPAAQGRFVTFVYYDGLLILRKDNIVELIK